MRGSNSSTHVGEREELDGDLEIILCRYIEDESPHDSSVEPSGETVATYIKH